MYYSKMREIEKRVIVELVHNTMRTSWHQPTSRNILYKISLLLHHYLLAVNLYALAPAAGVCLPTFLIIPSLTGTPREVKIACWPKYLMPWHTHNIGSKRHRLKHRKRHEIQCFYVFKSPVFIPSSQIIYIMAS